MAATHLVDIIFKFGGNFVVENGGVSYVGGEEHVVSRFDPDKLTLIDIRGLLVDDLHFHNVQTILYREPGKGLDEGLYEIKGDEDIRTILGFIYNIDQLEIYVQHAVDVPVIIAGNELGLPGPEQNGVHEVNVVQEDNGLLEGNANLVDNQVQEGNGVQAGHGPQDHINLIIIDDDLVVPPMQPVSNGNEDIGDGNDCVGGVNMQTQTSSVGKHNLGVNDDAQPPHATVNELPSHGINEDANVDAVKNTTQEASPVNNNATGFDNISEGVEGTVRCSRQHLTATRKSSSSKVKSFLQCNKKKNPEMRAKIMKRKHTRPIGKKNPGIVIKDGVPVYSSNSSDDDPNYEEEYEDNSSDDYDDDSSDDDDDCYSFDSINHASYKSKRILSGYEGSHSDDDNSTDDVQSPSEVDTSELPDSSSNADSSSDDSSDEEVHEEYLRQQNMNNYNPEVDVPDFELGMIFSSATEFREALRKYAVARRVGLRWVKNHKDRLRAKCVPGCPFVIYAARDNTEERNLIVKTYRAKHKCKPAYHNPTVTAKWLARVFRDRIFDEPGVKCKTLKKLAKKKMKLHVNYSMIRRAKHIVTAELEGSYKNEYAELEAYAHEIEISNPGSVMSVELDKELLEKGVRVFHRSFICFDACAKGWKAGCRKFIGLDGCFLKTICKGQILSAVGTDGSNQMFPIAWAVVQRENKKNWKWFLEWLVKVLGLGDGKGYNIISDMQKGLLPATAETLPEAEHRWCARHIFVNWRKKHRGEDMRGKFWKCAWSTYHEEFKDSVDLLAADHGVDAARDLLKYPAHRWARAYMSTRCKCDIVDNNISESFNSWVLEAREKHIISMLESIRSKCMQRLWKYGDAVKKWHGEYSPECMTRFDKNVDKSMECFVKFNGDHGYEIGQGEDRHAVFIDKGVCTCREWDLSGIPCPHAICALFHEKQDPEKYISAWYNKETYIRAYSYHMQPVRGRKFWKYNEFEPIQHPPIHIKPGRKQKNRKKDKVEDLKKKKTGNISRKGIVMRCSKCHQSGHNKKSCDKQKRNNQEYEVNAGNNVSYEASVNCNTKSNAVRKKRDFGVFEKGECSKKARSENGMPNRSRRSEHNNLSGMNQTHIQADMSIPEAMNLDEQQPIPVEPVNAPEGGQFQTPIQNGNKGMQSEMPASTEKRANSASRKSSARSGTDGHRSIPMMSDPPGAKAMGGKLKRAARSRVSGHGIFISEHTDRVIYNPCQSSEMPILPQRHECEGFGSPRFYYKNNPPTSSGSMHVSPPLQLQRQPGTVTHGQQVGTTQPRLPIVGPSVSTPATTSQPPASTAGRRIQFRTPEHLPHAPTDLPYKGTGLQWKGTEAMTARSLEEQRQMMISEINDRNTRKTDAI